MFYVNIGLETNNLKWGEYTVHKLRKIFIPGLSPETTPLSAGSTPTTYARDNKTHFNTALNKIEQTKHYFHLTCKKHKPIVYHKPNNTPRHVTRTTQFKSSWKMFPTIHGLIKCMLEYQTNILCVPSGSFFIPYSLSVPLPLSANKEIQSQVPRGFGI